MHTLQQENLTPAIKSGLGVGRYISSLVLIALLSLIFLPAMTWAGESDLAEVADVADLAEEAGSAAGRADSFNDVPVLKAYTLGINRFDLDEYTEILGWQLAESWYLGRQDGLDSGLTLVWQQDSNQLSVSKDGVRLTKRF